MTNRHVRSGRAHLALALTMVLGAIGCESYGVRSVDAKATPYHQKTVHSYLWNITQPEPLIVAEECGSAGISWVRADTNYLYWMAGVFTFGGWVPMTLYWRCDEPEPTR
jgi:hypothetical protein